MTCTLLHLPLPHSLRPNAEPELHNARLVALARAACAPKAALRRPFLRGRWHAAHVERVAAAVAALGGVHGDIGTSDSANAPTCIAGRLRHLLDTAPPVADGLNSLAEFLGGRASSHADRLALVVRNAALRAAEDAAPSAA